MDKTKQVFIPFFTLFILFLLDGVISLLFKSTLTFGNALMIPRLTFVGLVYFSFRLPIKQNMYLAVIFGFLTDSYYTGILGIYIAAFAITTYLASYIKERAHLNVLSVGMYMALMLFLLEIIAYSFYRWIGVTQLSIGHFFLFRYCPTLLFNAVSYLVIYLPLKNLLDYVGAPSLTEISA